METFRQLCNKLLDTPLLYIFFFSRNSPPIEINGKGVLFISKYLSSPMLVAFDPLFCSYVVLWIHSIFNSTLAKIPHFPYVAAGSPPKFILLFSSFVSFLSYCVDLTILPFRIMLNSHIVTHVSL